MSHKNNIVVIFFVFIFSAQLYAQQAPVNVKEDEAKLGLQNLIKWNIDRLDMPQRQKDAVMKSAMAKLELD